MISAKYPVGSLIVVKLDGWNDMGRVRPADGYVPKNFIVSSPKSFVIFYSYRTQQTIYLEDEGIRPITKWERKRMYRGYSL